jgi:hypothetical protein
MNGATSSIEHWLARREWMVDISITEGKPEKADSMESFLPDVQ